MALLAIVAPLLHFELHSRGAGRGTGEGERRLREREELRTAIERGALPVLIKFSPQLAHRCNWMCSPSSDRPPLLAALRFALIRPTEEVPVRSASLAGPPARFVWTGLISQAGVTLGLATIVAAECPDWGRRCGP